MRTFPWLRIYRKPEDGGGAPPAPASDPATPPAPSPAPAGDPPAPSGDPAPSAPAAFDWGKWTDGLSDADRKDYAKRFKGTDDLLDAAMTMRKDLSTRIKVPGKDASPEDVAAYRKALGADPDPANYKAPMPEGYQLGEVETALLGAMQKSAADQGLPTATFAEFTKTYFEMDKAVREKAAQEVADFQRDSTAALKKEFGADFDKLVRGAELFVNQRLNVPEFTELLNDPVQWKGVTIELRSHPAVVKMLAQIGQRTAEDGVIGYSTPEEKSSVQRQISDLEAKYPLGQRNKAQDAEIRGLYEKLYG